MPPWLPWHPVGSLLAPLASFWVPFGSLLAPFWLPWACLLAPLELWNSLEIGTWQRAKRASHLALWNSLELGIWQCAKRASHLALWNSLEIGTWQRAKRASHLVYIYIYIYIHIRASCRIWTPPHNHFVALAIFSSAGRVIGAFLLFWGHPFGPLAPLTPCWFPFGSLGSLLAPIWLPCGSPGHAFGT